MKIHFMGQEQSVRDMMEARDMRVQYVQHLLELFNSTVVSFKLNIPGPVKYSPIIRKIFDEGITAFKRELSENTIAVAYDKVFYKNSGPDYFAVLEVDPARIKKLAISVEETHPLGRIFDFDVINAKGSQVSREELGSLPRKCLLCGDDAFQCARSRTHKVTELTGHIAKLASDYFEVIEEEIQ